MEETHREVSWNGGRGRNMLESVRGGEDHKGCKFGREGGEGKAEDVGPWERRIGRGSRKRNGLMRGW